MKAVQIVELTGPDHALKIVDLPEPEASHPMTPGHGVVIDVHAAGVSFPEVLQTRGEYQFRPELPFVPGSEVAGVVRTASEGSGFAPGDRVAGFCFMGGFAEVAVAAPHMTVKLDDALDYAQGAGLILNYHTAYFSLVTRGRLKAGESVLIHGAAGGVGTASIQVANGLGATTIAVVSSEAKGEVAKQAGADHVVLTTGEWKDEVLALGGADVVIDPVGGDRFTDSIRSLKPGGRVVVVGFTGGSIPQVKVNRLLLKNVEIVGAGWGEYIMRDLEANAAIGAAVNELVAAGHIKPLVGARYTLETAADALKLIDSRGATGKVVLEVR